MTCGQCGAPLPRADVRFCTSCGAPTAGAGGSQPSGAAGGQQPPYQPEGTARLPQQPQYPPQGPYQQPQEPYGQQPYPPQGPYGPPPGGRPPSSGPNLVPILVAAVLVLVLLGGAAIWLLSRMDNPPLQIGRPAPTRTPTAVPTPTRAPGIGINIPGPQGTPTTVTIPLPIPGLGGNASPVIPQLPIPIPGISGSPDAPLPGASGTPPPSAKLTADEAREKVKETLKNCRLLSAQVEASQVTFEPPTWTVKLPLTGTSWQVNDDTGEVTPDERAAERTSNCRL